MGLMQNIVSVAPTQPAHPASRVSALGPDGPLVSSKAEKSKQDVDCGILQCLQRIQSIQKQYDQKVDSEVAEECVSVKSGPCPNKWKPIVGFLD
ncbi:hypothetical protein DPMN_141042 [Dreissena polymorpha]|uniref:Uncharacterized protein n=1 Tax=Dreissena polymorpha TaxID=45954 RepID=A0A9D4G1Q4_DREPO|nr:hypothetical protein DPMN_136884 [Dreissena polymorpha]KAH3812606.1 hypothetical protein DPMN_141042 [Dreissena polymorpha]